MSRCADERSSEGKGELYIPSEEFALYFSANMAAPQNMTDIDIQKNSKIVVNVDESLPDILVVTYEHGSKIYKGVLLDSTKR